MTETPKTRRTITFADKLKEADARVAACEAKLQSAQAARAALVAEHVGRMERMRIELEAANG